LVLRHAQEQREDSVSDAQQTLVNLTETLLQTCGLCEADLEMSVFVIVLLSVYSQDVEHALEQLCKVHVKVREQGDIW